MQGSSNGGLDGPHESPAPVEALVEAPVEALVIPVAPAAAPAGLVARNDARELVDAFLRGRNPNTLRAYRRDLEDFARAIGAESSEAAARQLLGCTAGGANALVLGYRTSLVERALSANTINRRLSALRAFVKLGRTLGLVAWHVEVEGIDVDPYRDTRGPGEAGVAAMLAVATARGGARGARDAALVRLLYDCGLRRGEPLSLDLVHYAPDRGLSLLGKGRHARAWVTLPVRAREALERWIEHRGRVPGPLFIALDKSHYGHRLTGSAVYAIIAQLGSAAGMRVRPHGLRHSSITTALDRTNGDVRAVQKFSRHRDVRTLMLYDDNRTDVGGHVAELVSLPDGGEPVMRGPLALCGRGHEHFDETAIGALCTRGECGITREPKAPRRITRR